MLGLIARLACIRSACYGLFLRRHRHPKLDRACFPCPTSFLPVSHPNCLSCPDTYLQTTQPIKRAWPSPQLHTPGVVCPIEARSAAADVVA